MAMTQYHCSHKSVFQSLLDLKNISSSYHFVYKTLASNASMVTFLEQLYCNLRVVTRDHLCGYTLHSVVCTAMPSVHVDRLCCT